MIEQLAWVTAGCCGVGALLGLVFRVIPLGWTLMFGMGLVVSGLVLLELGA